MHRSGRYITQPTGYKAFIPSDLPPVLQMDEPLQHLLSQADMALGRLDMMGYLLPNVDHILAMYVRKEALLSSQIEGTQATLEDLFEYESNAPVQNLEDVQEVVNYIKALNHGLTRIQEFPVSIRLIKEIHQILLTNSRGKERTPGEFRRSQNWIGPPGSTLKTASFIPPPPKEAIDAMGKLELYLHESNTLPALIICALIHYQFETIHPFLDGNGRLGRLLITFFLCWKGILQKPLLYLSYYFKLYRQEYYDRLNYVRERGDYEQWIAFFLRAVIWTADSALDTVKKVLNLVETHKKLLLSKKIPSPYAAALLDYLIEKPHIAIQDVAEKFEVSYQTAHTLIHQFQKIGILKEITEKKRGKRFSYWEYIDCLAEGTSI